MNYDLTQPCSECPFRRVAPPGWLGPWTPEGLVSHLKENDVMFECHQTIPDDDASDVGLQQCAGAAIFANNFCKRARDRDRAWHQDRLGIDDKDVFSHPQEFIDHHRSLGKVSGEMDA